MKFATCLFVFAVTFAVFSSTEAVSKRAVAFGRCPAKSTAEECKAYAEKMANSMNYCHTYDIHQNNIYWMSCGVISCDGDYTIVEEDLSKPYPDCCRTCKLKE